MLLHCEDDGKAAAIAIFNQSPVSQPSKSTLPQFATICRVTCQTHYAKALHYRFPALAQRFNSAPSAVYSQCNGTTPHKQGRLPRARPHAIIRAMQDIHFDALIHDPVHGYIPFVSGDDLPAGEVSERDLIDSRWVQRMRQIHQLQTAWWVFPAAEHTRFQHVVGVMHIASRATAALYDSLKSTCPDVPSRGYIETLLRVAGLLHDVGHGPFGHFFDDHFLKHHGLTHETLGAEIIRSELGDTLRGIRRNPNSRLEDGEQIDPDEVAYVIARPRDDEGDDRPRWLRFLRSLFCGLYTLDNMDFVLRDAYMSGFSLRSFDLDRLLHYSFFGPEGFTIHERGLSAMVRFIAVRADLFRSVYFHRTVRAIDLTLSGLFAESGEYLFSGNPLDDLDAYRRFTEWTLLVDVARWSRSDAPQQRALGERWDRLLERRLDWRMAAERTLYFDPDESEGSSIFSRPEFVEQALRDELPADLSDLTMHVDLPRHVHRPGTRGGAAGQNFLYDPARGETHPLTASALFRKIPLSFRICRVYTQTADHDGVIATALEKLVTAGGADSITNM